MTPTQLIFLITCAVSLVSALMVVLSPKLVHAALWLILTLAGIAVLFVLLSAGFLAVVQVAVYIDAIAILIIIVVMLTRRAMQEDFIQVTRSWWLAAAAALLLFVGLVALLQFVPNITQEAPHVAADQETLLQNLGRALVDVDQLILPFEVASILLLAALVGSIMIAWPRGTGAEEVE